MWSGRLLASGKMYGMWASMLKTPAAGWTKKTQQNSDPVRRKRLHTRMTAVMKKWSENVGFFLSRFHNTFLFHRKQQPQWLPCERGCKAPRERYSRRKLWCNNPPCGMFPCRNFITNILGTKMCKDSFVFPNWKSAKPRVKKLNDRI